MSNLLLTSEIPPSRASHHRPEQRNLGSLYIEAPTVAENVPVDQGRLLPPDWLSP
jgi:hypothetical protein